MSQPVRHLRSIGLCVLVALCGSCVPEKPQKRGAQGRVVSGRESEAVIEVGAEELSVEEVQARLAVLRAVLPGAEASDAQLGVIAEFELLADEAERRGYGDDPRVVNAVKDALARSAPSDAQEASAAGSPRVVDQRALDQALEDGRKKRP